MRENNNPMRSGGTVRSGFNYRVRTLADTASAVGSMLLFLLFAVCMLMAIAVAADTYSRLKSGYQQSFGTVTSIKYISNKLRAADNVMLLEDGAAAAVESAGTVCVIYCGSDGLYEKTAMSDEIIAADGGDKISDIDSMSITEHDGLYEITVRSRGESASALVRRG